MTPASFGTLRESAYDAAGECARALIALLPRQPQNPHAGVIVMYHAALCCLPDYFLQHRPDQARGSRHQFPLRGRWQRHRQLTLQLFQSVKRHARAVLQQRDHRHGCRIILIVTGRLWGSRSEDLSAGVAPQPLHLEYRRLQRRLLPQSVLMWLVPFGGRLFPRRIPDRRRRTGA